jgi:hypothetical protein
MKHAVVLAILVCGFAVPSFAQNTCKRNLESGFSYCPPDGWTIKPSLDDKFKLFLGPTNPTFVPNINVKDEENMMTLAEDVASNVKNMLANPAKMGVRALNVVSQAEFVTTSGQRGTRVTFHLENTEGLKIRALQYYFSGRGDQKLVVSCLTLESTSDVNEPLFERSLKTLQIDR